MSGHTISLILCVKEVFLQILPQVPPPLCPQDVLSLALWNVTNSNQFNPCCQILAYVKQCKGSNTYVPVFQYYEFFGQKRHLFLTFFLNIFNQIMRFEKQQKKPIFIPPSATDHYIFCCCCKRQDNENRAGRVGMVTLWQRIAAPNVQRRRRKAQAGASSAKGGTYARTWFFGEGLKSAPDGKNGRGAYSRCCLMFNRFDSQI